MKSILAILFATTYGITVRYLFGFLNGIMNIMSLSFLIIVPFIIGFLTVLLVLYKRSVNGWGAFFLPWITTSVILVVTIFLEIEGIICWMMIYPLFSIAAGLGGLLALHYKKNKLPLNNTNINEETLDGGDTLKISLFLLLPFLVGSIEGDRTLTKKKMNIRREVIIDASATKVWNQILNIETVEKGEKTTHFSNFMGFPEHINTTLDTGAVGGKRVAYYERGLFFEETITEYEPEKRMVLDIYVDPKKVPPTAMDEHIVIGGRYVDLDKDVYEMKTLEDGSVKLSLTSYFHINTPFNWYSGIWASYLMEDLLSGELQLIKERSISD